VKPRYNETLVHLGLFAPLGNRNSVEDVGDVVLSKSVMSRLSEMSRCATYTRNVCCNMQSRLERLGGECNCSVPCIKTTFDMSGVTSLVFDTTLSVTLS
jgi:hypothetical protein